MCGLPKAWDDMLNPPMFTVSEPSWPLIAPLPYWMETGWFLLEKLLEDDGLYFLTFEQPCVHDVDASHRSLEPVSKITPKVWPIVQHHY